MNENTIPELTEEGLLPPGTFLTSLDEIETRFGGSSEIRRQLMGELKELCSRAERAGVNRVIVAGSFPSLRPHPMDLDGIVFGPPSADWELLLPYCRLTPERVANVRSDFMIAPTISSLNTLLGFFTRTRDANCRGLLEIPILGMPQDKVLVNPYLFDFVLDVQLDKAKESLESTTSFVQREALEQYIASLEKKREAQGVDDFYRQCLRAEVSMLGGRGRGDIQVNSLIGLIMANQGACRIVDFGCGKGRLISELATLDKIMLSTLEYIGLDYETSAAEATARECGLYDTCSAVCFGAFDEAKKWYGTADFVILINVLHEVPLVELPTVVSGATRLSKPNGLLIFHDMEHLVRGERSFIPWEGAEIAQLLRDSGFEASIRTHTSNSGVPLYTCMAWSPSPTVIDPHVLAGHLRQTICEKERLLVKQRSALRDEPGNEREYAYLSVAIANIKEQLSREGNGAGKY